MANNTTELLYQRPENVTSISGFLLKHPNEQYLSGGLGYGIMLIVFVIAFGSTARLGVDRAFAVAAFINFLTATMLVLLGVIGAQGWAVAFIALIVAVVVNSGSGGGAIQ